MIDHVTLQVSDLARSKLFYETSFAALGYRLAFGEPGIFWAFDIDDGLFEIMQAKQAAPLSRVHVALRVKSRADVDEFSRAAMAAGGRDNGAPGLRPHYHPNYYAAFVLDPDGNNIEAVSHRPE
jgi:catechol 2,3-dioxygenase-like lactoylglutathione lyase family enzyme